VVAAVVVVVVGTSVVLVAVGSVVEVAGAVVVVAVGSVVVAGIVVGGAVGSVVVAGWVCGRVVPVVVDGPVMSVGVGGESIAASMCASSTSDGGGCVVGAPTLDPAGSATGAIPVSKDVSEGPAWEIPISGFWPPLEPAAQVAANTTAAIARMPIVPHIARRLRLSGVIEMPG
jgi:hypothetical protein